MYAIFFIWQNVFVIFSCLVLYSEDCRTFCRRVNVQSEGFGVDSLWTLVFSCSFALPYWK